jgi:diacylglycerol kinase (ATP)
MTDVEEASQSRRCAVIYNSTKISDKFRALVEEGLHQKGWGNTLWLETSVEDPGGAITRQAVAVHVDLVIAAGGDGTIRAVADALAHRYSARTGTRGHRQPAGSESGSST